MSKTATFDLTSHWFFADPGPTLDRLREWDPVSFQDELGAWVLTRYADVAAALADDRLEPCLPGEAPAREASSIHATVAAFLPFGGRPPEGALRRRFEAALSPPRLVALRPLVESMVAELVGPLEARDAPFDLVHELSEPLAVRAIAAFVGVPEPDLARIAARAEAIFGLSGLPNAAAASSTAGPADDLVELAGYFEDLLDRKRPHASADLASALVEAVLGETVPLRDVAHATTAFVLGALPFARHLTSHALLGLLTRADAWARVVREPFLARSAIDETLRHNGPVLCVMRRSRANLTIGNRSIRAGERVGCMVYAANRDPSVFESPGTFDLDRRPSPHLGFGTFGPSLGDGLPRLVAELAVAAVARRMPGLQLSGSSPRVGALALRGLARLPVRRRHASRVAAPAEL